MAMILSRPRDKSNNMLPIIILHGWSDTSDSFQALAIWLRTNGFDVIDIFLGDYLSMNDEITLFDLGLAFRRALEKNNIPQARHSFNLVVHSTGGLVAREYLRQFCLDSDTGIRDATKTPIQHLCMLAPANFGSPLATLGKSILGRIFKGWKWDGFGESGKRVLDALELASPYSYDLALDDLFDASFSIFAPSNTLTTILTGTAPYPDSLRSSLHEDGSDGTVRVATANLMASYFKVNFQSKKERPSLTSRPSSVNEIAVAVFLRNHASITDPTDRTQQSEWTNLVKRALTITPAEYQAHVEQCDAVTVQTFDSGTLKEKNHQYQHMVVRVHDQHGEPVDDYIIEFYQQPRDRPDNVFKKIHTEILEKVTKNQKAANYRSFFFDVTDLQQLFKETPDAKVEMSITAAHISKRIQFRNPEKGFEIFSRTQSKFIKPNQPILMDITLHRDPNVDSTERGGNVFKLKAT